MAAHAFAMHDHDVLIYSKKRKSEMYGAQYLHAPIPGMTTSAPVEVTYKLQGTPDAYRTKVYGKDSRTPVSPESLVGRHLGWDIRGTYHELWLTYGEYVQDYNLSPESFDSLRRATWPDLIVNTVPRPLLCREDAHSFTAQQVWAIGDAPERGVFSPIKVEKNTVICNGESSPAWYRASTIFGYSTVEWPHAVRPPYTGVSQIDKPLRHTCDCWSDVTHLGRFGKWSKGALSHEAFQDALELAA